MHPTLRKSGYVLLLSLSVLLLCSSVWAVQLSWQAPTTRTDGTAATAAGFNLYYRQAGQTTYQRIDVGPQTDYTLQGLTVGQTYYFYVTAYDTSDRESAPSNEASITVANSTTARAPVANNDTVSTPEDTSVTTGNVLANDTDANGDALSIASFTQPARGSVVRNGTTAFTYTPQANFFGTDTFTYTIRDPGGLTATGTVTVTVTAVNDRPVAQADSATTTAGTAVTISVLTNDSDVDNDPLTVSTTTNASGGTVTRNGNTVGNTVTYTPNPGFTGTGSFSYTVSDGRGETATATVTVTVTAAGTASSLTTGLVAAYNFDAGSGTTLADLSGNGHTGTIAGATWTTAGKYGRALAFDGVNDWVTIADTPRLDFTTGATFMAWVYSTATSGIRDLVVKEGTGIDIYNLYARNRGGRPESNVYVSGRNQVAEGATLPTDVWVHLAGTYTGSVLRLYVGGVEVAQRAVSGPIATSGGPLRLGGNSMWGEYFQGRLDDVRLYNRALATSEVQTAMTTPISPLSSGSQQSATAMATSASGATVKGQKTSTRVSSLPPGAAFRATTTSGTVPLAPGRTPNETSSNTVTPPESTAESFEFGEVQIDSTWHTVTFHRPFDDPIVVAKLPSNNDRAPALVQIRNVTRNGFESRLQAWDDLQGVHAQETVSYLVVERGQHTLGGNVYLEAGSTLISPGSSFVTVPFSQAFTVAPVVLTAVVSTNAATAVTTRVRDVTPDSFQVRMQGQHRHTQSHVAETIMYIAWMPSSGTLAGGLVFEVQKTLEEMAHKWQTLTFIERFTALPVFLADLQTADGGDSAGLLWENKDFFGVDVQVVEAHSARSAIQPTTAAVGYIALAFHDVTTDSDGDGVTNADEVLRYGTDPMAADTDQDEIDDGDEVQCWGTRWEVDTDGDGLINLLDCDSDNDGIVQGAEQ